MKKTFEVLNGYEIIDKLNIKEYNNNMKLTYNELVYKCTNSWNKMIIKEVIDDDLNERKLETENPNYIELMSDNKMYKFRKKYYTYNDWMNCWSLITTDDDRYVTYDELLKEKWQKHWKEQELLDYLGIIPFTPSVMINISPDWGSAKEKMTNTTKAKRLEKLVNDYLVIDQRYDYYSYVIENGWNGEHIHAHIVAHMNPKIGKSVESHLGGGRHLGVLQTCAKKIKGMEGTIKGPGVTKTYIRNKEILNDKLDYLIEEKKPEGHKNKSVLTGRVDKVLFTVK